MKNICQLNGCISAFFTEIEASEIDGQTNLEAVSRSKNLDYGRFLELLPFPCPRPLPMKLYSARELVGPKIPGFNIIRQPVDQKIQMAYQSRVKQFLGAYEFYGDEWARSVGQNSTGWSMTAPETSFSVAPESLQKTQLMRSFHKLDPRLRTILQPTVEILSGRAYHTHKQLVFHLLVSILIQYETIQRDCVTAVDEVRWYEPT